MTKAEYMAFHASCCKRMIETTRKKNADYTGVGDDPFANFSRVESLGIASTEQGFLTRMLDKFCRLISFSQKGFLEVSDESVEDSLMDLANYCILLAGYLRRKRATAIPGPEVQRVSGGGSVGSGTDGGVQVPTHPALNSEWASALQREALASSSEKGHPRHENAGNAPERS